MGIQARIAARIEWRLPGDHKLHPDDFIMFAASDGMGLSWSARRWRDMAADMSATAGFMGWRGYLSPADRIRLMSDEGAA